jgi:hypothetical protein
LFWHICIWFGTLLLLNCLLGCILCLHFVLGEVHYDSKLILPRKFWTLVESWITTKIRAVTTKSCHWLIPNVSLILTPLFDFTATLGFGTLPWFKHLQFCFDKDLNSIALSLDMLKILKHSQSRFMINNVRGQKKHKHKQSTMTSKLAMWSLKMDSTAPISTLYFLLV